MATEFQNVLGASGAKSPAGLIAALEARGAYVVADGESTTANTYGNAVYLIFNGRMFHYDSGDASTAHDGVTCCVTQDGKRFKADGFGGGLLRIFSVVSRTLTAPPGSPTIGQQWIVAVGGTGAWAGKDKYVAAWTARGWVFTVPQTYDLAMVAADAQYYNFAVSNLWVAGLPAVVLGASSVSPIAIKYNRFGLTVINQTTNAPPGSPTDGDAYIIGPTPTGAWAANARKIAIYETSSWVIYPVRNGDTVYDAGTSSQVKFDGTAWAALTSGYANASHVFTAAEVVGLTSLNGYTYSPTTAPTTALANETDSAAYSAYSAKKSGAILEINYQASIEVTTAGAGYVTLGLQVDSTVTMADWISGPTVAAGRQSISVTFITTTSDALPHDYKIRFFGVRTSGAIDPHVTFSRRRITIRERS